MRNAWHDACRIQWASALLWSQKRVFGRARRSRDYEDGMRIRLTLMMIGCVVALVGSACNKSTVTAPSSVVSVTVSGAQAATPTFQLQAAAHYADATVSDVTSQATWQSSNTQVATVTGTGMVTAVGQGEANVTATFGGQVGSFHATIAPSPVTALTLSGMPSGPVSAIQLSAAARRQNGASEDVTSRATWESSNPQIATVSNGLVRGVDNGTVLIRASFEGVQAEAAVSVATRSTITIRGVVTEAAPNAVAVPGARVSALVGQSTITDVGGNFVLSGVPAGSFIFEVAKDGYEILSGLLNSDTDVRMNFTVYPTPPENASQQTATARCNDRTWSWAQTRAAACALNGGVAYTVCPGPLCSN